MSSNFERVTYREITEAIQTKDTSRFKFTIETDPAYGKYHWTGHRNCNVSLSPQEARNSTTSAPSAAENSQKALSNGWKNLLTDPTDYKAANSPGFMRLMPLSEIIATVLDADSPSTQAVWKIYNPSISKFGDEYKVLIDAPKEALAAAVVDPRIADAIVKVREGKVTVVPGYDGVYGKLVLPTSPRRNLTLSPR